MGERRPREDGEYGGEHGECLAASIHWKGLALAIETGRCLVPGTAPATSCGWTTRGGAA